ncbi:MAG: acyltransferase family protein, partial [Pseudomonadota bacterium]|nr:acyltransferase family protein [Pseudomonadota bacterium]
MPFQLLPPGVATDPPSTAAHDSTAIFIDLLRVLAAFIVFLGHLTWTKFSDLPWITGHGAVMIFFVISGYVIALTTDIKDATLRQYAVARLARLYSVVLPALLLTYVADSIGMRFNAALYDGEPHDHALFRLLSAATYTCQLWFLNINPLSNMPYWSLPYEFIFYVMWGVYFYLRGKTRVLLLAGVALIAGPKILMYLPIWLIGVAAYRLRRISLNRQDAGFGLLAGFVFLPVLYIVGRHTRYDIAFVNGVAGFR